jgi:polyhydroxyalkanoate synthesis regulator phasin
MTVIGNSLSSVVESAALRAGTQLQTADINRILAKLEEGIGEDRVTFAELHKIDQTIDKLVRQGRISHDRGAQFSGQIRGAVGRAIQNEQLRASETTKQWLRFVDTGSNASIRRMATNAATDRRGVFGFQKMTGKEVKQLLDVAARDGTITLSEINSMYDGVNDAYRAGRISMHERNNMIHSLESSLKAQAGRRRGMCARRIQGPYNNKLSPEAKDFIEQQLGGRAGRKSGKGWTTWRFDKVKTQQYVKSISKDGHVSDAERKSLVNRLLRDGRASWNELQTVRQAFAWAVWQRAITPQEYNRTLRLFDLEIAQYTGGQRVGNISQDLQVQRDGFQMFRG